MLTVGDERVELPESKHLVYSQTRYLYGLIAHGVASNA